MSVNLTKFTRALRIYPSPYPIPSPYVLTTGQQNTEGLSCLVTLLTNEQDCYSCFDISATNIDDENPATINFTTCSEEGGSISLGPSGSVDLGCLSSWSIEEGNVEFYNNGGCGAPVDPAYISYIDCNGNELETELPCQQGTNLGCIQSWSASGGIVTSETDGSCGEPVYPYQLLSDTSNFELAGVSVGDIVYVYNNSNVFQFITVVVGIISANTIETADYIPIGYYFTIYQQSAQSGLGNRGCTLFFPLGYDNPLGVNTITNTNFYSDYYPLSPNTLFPIQISHFLVGDGIGYTTYALW